ncbi:hypothetical protein C1H46_037606 [Malus baccata]|uniref:Serpin domain-containing protein n=1 Tax=Malus baccata TaxID=106549 RepID=A0A540KRL2_MALBA|nr:hypothetical protein C1H46_037606 [Malus baccata]
MKVEAAYLLAVLGGKTSPSAEDLKDILGSVGAVADDDRIQLLLSEVESKDITELIASGREKLASSVPSGGGDAIAVDTTGDGFGGMATPATAGANDEANESFPFSDCAPDSFTMDPKEASNLTDVSLKITTHLLVTEGKSKNIVYSPLSIQVMLWLITAGSKGPTQDQMLSFLKSNSVDQLNSLASHLVPLVFANGSARGGPCLCFANGLWVKKSLPIKPAFKQVVDSAYKATIKQVSFKNPEEVRREVNLWAEKATKGIITEALPPESIDKKTMLVISNALYFKGLWKDKFKASKTKEYDFHLINGTSVKAQFMTSDEDQFVKAFDGFKVLKLHYARGKDRRRKFSMYLLLPNTRDGLPSLVERVCTEPNFLDRYCPETQVEVGDFKVPRFKFSSSFKASDILKDLGLVLPFNGEGDLTEMVESSPDGATMFHKSFIEVNEEGTEAAAVSSYVDMYFCYGPLSPRKKIDFVADHPFMFFIREEKTETVMFIGQVLNPLEE